MTVYKWPFTFTAPCACGRLVEWRQRIEGVPPVPACEGCED